MSKRLTLISLTILCAGLLVAGCATTPPPPSQAEQINSACGAMAAQMASEIPAGSHAILVAVVPFRDDSRQATALCQTLRERLTDDLVGQHGVFQVVDQADLDKVLSTMKQENAMADAMDPGTISKLGQLVGAQAIVTGTVTDAQNVFNIECRIVNSTTSVILASASSSVGKANMLSQASEGGTIPVDTSLQPLVAPVALYPDPILADILPAATFPDQVVAASVYLKTNPSPTDDELDAQPWDPSVQAVAHYPVVVDQMAADPQWTTSLGAAFSTEQPEVIATVQDLRLQAYNQKNLEDTSDQNVTDEDGTIYIEPASQIVVLPTYDPITVYHEHTTIIYSDGHAMGPWLAHSVDWREHRVYQGQWNEGLVRGPDGLRPDPHWVRPATAHAWERSSRWGAAPQLRKVGYVEPHSMHGQNFRSVPNQHKVHFTHMTMTDNGQHQHHGGFNFFNAVGDMAHKAGFHGPNQQGGGRGQGKNQGGHNGGHQNQQEHHEQQQGSHHGKRH